MDDVTSPLVTRRRVLAAAGTAAVAGCTGDGDGGGGEDTETRGGSGAGTGTGTGTGDGNGTGTERGTDVDYDHPTPSEEPGWEAPGDAPGTDVRAERLVENLEIPWDVAFAGAGDLFVTERPGRILRFDAGEVAEVARPRDAIDAGVVAPGSDESNWFVEGGEGGTLGIAAHPEFPDEEYIYVYYTASTGGGKENRVVRYDAGAPDVAASEETVVGGIPAARIHNGGRIRFGPDGNLWICTGDAGDGRLARDLESLGGKVLRVRPDGSAPADNPDLDGDSRIFTYGHRNPQGIDWLPSGVPVATEHGPSARDEVNVLVPGGDYGWNVARDGSGEAEWDAYGAHEEFVPPVVNTGPSAAWAPTGATFYAGGDVPSWRNRLVVGGLVSQSVWIVTLTPGGAEAPPADGARQFDADWLHPAYTATAHRVLEDDLGRVRHVAGSPDGALYAITSNRDGRAAGSFPRDTDDVLVRLTPA